MAKTFRPGRGSREQDRPVPWRFRLGLFGLGVAAWLVQLAARSAPDTVESLYARELYPLIRDVTGAFTGWTRHSLVELFLFVAGGIVLLVALRTSSRLAAGTRSPRNAIAQATSAGLALTGVLVAWGVLGWGLNYHRQPLAVTAGLDVSPASAAELRRLSETLAARAGELREPLPEDGHGAMRTVDEVDDALGRAPRAFGTRIGDDEALVGPGVTRPKAVRAPLPWLGISGVFSMFTSEPNVAGSLPPVELLASACHELAHQLGWAREDEAEFVGHVACRIHPDADYRYATTQTALQRSLRALQRTDPEAAATIAAGLHPGIVRDWRAVGEYWRRYDTPLAEAGARMNDAYLKSQGQTAGIESYGLMVDLLIGDLRRAERRRTR